MAPVQNASLVLNPMDSAAEPQPQEHPFPITSVWLGCKSWCIFYTESHNVSKALKKPLKIFCKNPMSLL